MHTGDVAKKQKQ